MERIYLTQPTGSNFLTRYDRRVIRRHYRYLRTDWPNIGRENARNVTARFAWSYVFGKPVG